MLSNIEQVKARGGRVIAVATDGDNEVADKADDVIWIPRAGDYITAILAAIPLQLFAYHMAVLRGLRRRPAQESGQERHRRVTVKGGPLDVERAAFTHLQA